MLLLSITYLKYRYHVSNKIICNCKIVSFDTNFHLMHIFLIFKILACFFACLIDIGSMLTCHQCKDKDNNANCASSKDLGDLVTCEPKEVCLDFKYRGMSALSSSYGINNDILLPNISWSSTTCSWEGFQKMFFATRTNVGDGLRCKS